MSSIINDETNVMNDDDEKYISFLSTTSNTSSSNDGHSSNLMDVNFDLICKLYRFPHIIEQIFSYLPGTYLRIIPCICKSWNDIIKHVTPLANKRRICNLKKLRKMKRNVGRENWPLDVECAMFKKKRRKFKQEVINTMISIENNLPKITDSHTSRSVLGIRDINSNESIEATALQGTNQLARFSRSKRRLQIVDDNVESNTPIKRTRWKLAMASSKHW